ncbi:MAG: thiamine pyrophosphate-dependent dehydrogenase E1 component subunit alpha [Candidatus Nitrohelix vancouverensis]|uniref:Thiamine pyrophosphate-dependent dehydrogenase E1 component subunit alpha n=1 Tax=Candidatus Nitrohelix vancouverensis TaxID=2705534 RepID=A0A7T0G3E2_9BACT|nr:MAG: thiamine pyrophosphate-dependent dehydrogenase E1 component subunit alpha [Candidatus Nitrohelix vancouverensis]
MIKFKYEGKGFQGRPSENLPYSQDQVLSMLRSMLRVRLLEEKIETIYHLDEMKTPVHLVIGQEAISTGCCEALRPEDHVYGTYRTHGNYIAKGGDLKKMLSELYCRADGCVGSKGGSMHLLDKDAGFMGCSAIVSGILPIATGAALSAKMLKQDRVTVVFFGEAGTEEGVLWESFNFAALKKLPIIYICENNFYAVCSPLENRQPPGVDIYKKAESFGIKSRLVDGTNVLDVYDAVRDASDHVRNGEGPYFIEARAYRWRGHGGVGDDSASGYRDPKEVEAWKKYCPIETFYNYLGKCGMVDSQLRKEMTRQLTEEIEAAFEHGLKSPNPVKEDLATFVYCD